ncbi:MAG: DUF2752 domain-containing protein [Pseudoflavonifractor sp.]
MSSIATTAAAMTSKQRLLRVFAWAGLLVTAGLAYALFVRSTGWSIPCPFHLVTGLLCPGCGVTRMCLALLRLDFAGAWAANPGLMLLLVPMSALFGSMVWRWVKTGQSRPTRVQSACIWGMVAYLLIYGGARNLC